MKQTELDRVVRSTISIVMSNPTNLLPTGLGSGCLVRYGDERLLLSVAHVTDKDAATCIVVDDRPVRNTYPIYCVGAMNYVEKWDLNRLKEQQSFFDKSIPREAKAYGLIDLSYTLVDSSVVLKQRAVQFGSLTIEAGSKLDIQVNLEDKPNRENQYAFCGRVRPLFVTGGVDQLEMTETLRHGLRFVAQRGDYYEFELPQDIQDDLDYIGTSGAPIMDADGKLIALVTHGYEGSRRLFGIALAHFKTSIDAYIATERKNG